VQTSCFCAVYGGVLTVTGLGMHFRCAPAGQAAAGMGELLCVPSGVVAMLAWAPEAVKLGSGARTRPRRRGGLKERRDQGSLNRAGGGDN
jgi:hypothetical protein